jgi:hypothetical protein
MGDRAVAWGHGAVPPLPPPPPPTPPRKREGKSSRHAGRVGRAGLLLIQPPFCAIKSSTGG